ncbi:MAG: hypothetical protein JO145_06330 [Acidobacteriaceae bacterium]|nr:hypothetical protein [Acidobacteriaceae bacterium]
MTKANKTLLKQRNKCKLLDIPPSDAELEQLWSSKLGDVFYYCNAFSSHAEQGQDIILPLDLELARPSADEDEGDQKRIAAPDKEGKIVIVFPSRKADNLRRSMRGTFKQLDQQKEILKREERLRRTRRETRSEVLESAGYAGAAENS